jgi:hypothetical protein
MKKRKTFWRLLAKSLGEKASKCDREADKVALIRLVMFLSIFITNCFIVANAMRHWNDVPSEVSKTEEKGILNSNCNLSQD